MPRVRGAFLFCVNGPPSRQGEPAQPQLRQTALRHHPAGGRRIYRKTQATAVMPMASKADINLHRS
jgi:hypothetical protein